MRAFAVILFLSLAALSSGNGLPSTPYIYVQGSATEWAAPDTVRLRFVVSARQNELATGRKIVGEKSDAVIGALAELRLPASKITAQSMTWEAEYEFENSQRHFKGYTVQRPFEVTLDDLSIYPQLLDRLIEVGVENSQEPKPFVSRAAEIERRLQKKALEDAHARARQIAEDSGLRVVGVFAVSPVTFPSISGEIFSAPDDRILKLDRFESTGSLLPLSGRTYFFEQQKFEGRLHVIFLVEPANPR